MTGARLTHLVTIVGARPQFIKAAPVSRALAEQPGARETMVHTGQHFDPEMSQSFFRALELPQPAHNLGIHGGGHGAMTGRMLQALEPILPGAVLSLVRRSIEPARAVQ